MIALCFACETGRLVLTTIPEVVQHNGNDVLVPDYEALVCDNCEERFVSPEVAKRNAPRIADAKRRSEGLLTGGEIAAIRKGMGLSQSDAAEIFGGGVNAFSKYERGEVVQSKAMDLLLRLTVEIPAARTSLMSRAGMQLAAPEHGWAHFPSNVVRADFRVSKQSVQEIVNTRAGESRDWHPMVAAGGEC